MVMNLTERIRMLSLAPNAIGYPRRVEEMDGF